LFHKDRNYIFATQLQVLKLLIDKLDFWGMFTSLLCAIHCALLPFLLSVGLMGSSMRWINHPAFEVIVTVLSAVFVYQSLLRGYASGIVRRSTFILALCGLIMILSHHFFGSFATPIVVIGGISIATAHFQQLFFPFKGDFLKESKI